MVAPHLLCGRLRERSVRWWFSERVESLAIVVGVDLAARKTFGEDLLGRGALCWLHRGRWSRLWR